MASELLCSSPFLLKDSWVFIVFSEVLSKILQSKPDTQQAGESLCSLFPEPAGDDLQVGSLEVKV